MKYVTLYFLFCVNVFLCSQGKQKRRNDSKDSKGDQTEGEVYENIKGLKQNETQFNGFAENQKAKDSEQRGYKNQDGLLYIDVKFDGPPKRGRPIIHGEERTDYAFLEFEVPPTNYSADVACGAEGGE